MAGLRPNFFSSGRFFLAELAQESWQDLAAVPYGSQLEIDCVSECVHIQHQLIKPFCSLENVSSCKMKKKRRRMLKKKEKSLSLFLQAEFCCYFVQHVLFVR
jgi:hypothetical protein